MKINAMDVGPVGTINSGLSPHLREAKKKRKTNQGLGLLFFFNGSVSISWSNKLLQVEFL